MLLLIDIQPGFSRAAKSLIDPATRLIARARSRGERVLALHYTDEGEYPSLLPLYDEIILKDSDTGFPALSRAGVLPPPTELIRVAGCNTCYCVGDTVTDLHRNGYKVRLLSSCLNCCPQWGGGVPHTHSACIARLKTALARNTSPRYLSPVA